MAIGSQSELVAAMASSQDRNFWKTGTAPKSAGASYSYWTTAGMPGAGAAQGSANGAIPTSATAGSFAFANPVAPALSYLTKASLSATQAGMYEVYDRLWHNSLSATVTTAQTVTQPALTRYTTGLGVELWVEVHTATTAAATATISYTNSDGTSGRSATVSITAATLAGQMFPVNLAAGDGGVRSVQSLTLSASMTAGTFGLVLAKPLLECPVIAANTGVSYGPFDTGVPQIADNACLAFRSLASNTTASSIEGTVNIGQG